MLLAPHHKKILYEDQHGECYDCSLLFPIACLHAFRENGYVLLLCKPCEIEAGIEERLSAVFNG